MNSRRCGLWDKQQMGTLNWMFIEWKLITASNGFKESNGNIDKNRVGGIFCVTVSRRS